MGETFVSYSLPICMQLRFLVELRFDFSCILPAVKRVQFCIGDSFITVKPKNLASLPIFGSMEFALLQKHSGELQFLLPQDFTRDFLGEKPLVKKPENSGYEININTIPRLQHENEVSNSTSYSCLMQLCALFCLLTSPFGNKLNVFCPTELLRLR